MISMIFCIIYTDIKPYLMPSNNTFAIFVHFQVTFTLLCTLLLRMMESYTESEKDEMSVNAESIAWALLISNVSVIVFGSVFIIRACFNTSEGDFLDAGFGVNTAERKENERETNNIEMAYISSGRE